MAKCTIIVFLILLVLTGSAGAAAEKGIGSIIALKGEASVVRGVGAAQDLKLKGAVFLNDKILTKADSKLQIMFDDDSVVSQGENSEMVIDEYVYTPDKKDANSCSVKFAKGMFRVVAGKITEINPDSFKVKTRMATIGIRGCELGFRLYDQREDVYILYLPEGKSIVIDAIESLNQGINMAGINNSLTIVQSGIAVAIEPGAGLSDREISSAEARDVFEDSSSISKSSGGDDNAQGDDDNGGNAGGMPEDVACVIDNANQFNDDNDVELPPVPSGPGADAGAPHTAPPGVPLAMPNPGHPTDDTWEWGIWDDGAVFVSGNRYIGAEILPVADYQTIAANATVYNLSTPFPGGLAGALVKDGAGYSATIMGSAMLNATIGNGPGNWGGTFNLGPVGPGPASDALSFSVTGEAIDANGNLQLTTVGGYSLTVNSITVAGGPDTISGGGNLVRDPARAGPVDGIVGEFHFTHLSGHSADGAFGGDFAAP